MEINEKPTLIYQKNAEKRTGRIILPKTFLDKYGYNYYMEIYKDIIVLKPVPKEEK